MTRMQADADKTDFKIRVIRVWHIRVIRVWHIRVIRVPICLHPNRCNAASKRSGSSSRQLAW